jgi:hypothetical protein
MRFRRSRASRALAARLAPTAAVASSPLFAFLALFGTSALCAAPVAVSVDPNADRHPVSPLIYGMNFGTAAQMARLKVPVRRWGGNATTRYNWEIDTNNSASDWFFTNYAGSANPASLPNGSAADVFVDEIRAAGGEALVTVPLIGWTPVDRVRRWGFSVGKYGAQQQTECTASGNASWCNPDAGNGVKPNGQNVTGNDPADTSKPIDATFVTRWMSHLAGRVGTAAAGGVRLWALDNEPMLWNSTHRDVHPAGTSYDELWNRTATVGAAIKAQDAGAKILGPAVWGWCAYFYSGLDGCAPGADRAAHGNEDFLPWFLDQAKAWETAHGTRLLDYLDVHYYPQAAGVALTTDESTATSALRLRTLKSLYDPSYLDESWIGTDVGQAVDLIPRMKAWIAAHAPGTKLAISEYNWGSDAGISGALAQAEALAIFGREGVDLATRWVAPLDGSLTEDAFLLYRNYDGAGGQVAGDSVRATSANVDLVGAYAERGGPGGNTLYLLLFNKDTSAQSVSATVAGGLTGSASLFRFTGASRLAAAGSAAPSGGTLTLDLPARSATLAVVALAPPPPPAGTAFHVVTPCRVLDTRGAGGQALAANVRRTVTLTGVCGIPPTARSVSANVTVTAPTAGGNLVAFPADLGAAPGTNTLSFSAGQTRANNAMLLLSGDGSGAAAFTALMASGTVHLVVDVNGWWE